MTEYFDIAVTPSIIELQERKGSRELHAHAGDGDGAAEPARPHRLDGSEIEMITTRDSFYLATVGETGWPYVQHRGDERGFVRVLDDHTIGWVERNGNRQYLRTDNITSNGRIAAILVDYPTRTRLKLYGTATYHPDPSVELLAELETLLAATGV